MYSATDTNDSSFNDGEDAPDIHSSSDMYARRFSGPVGEWMLDIQLQCILKGLSEKNITSILDVGGGHAQVTPALVEAGFDVTVLGSTEGCANRLSHVLSDGRCEFRVGSLRKFPFEDKSFDAVVCMRQLSHVKDWKEFVGELSRVAKVAVIVDYPPKLSFNFVADHLFFAKRHFESNTTRPFMIFQDREVADAFRGNGFEPIRLEREFFLPMVFHRMCKSKTISAALEAGFRLGGMTRYFGSPVILTLVSCL
ncbi:MAG: class I SAM-dependent methyltransferase [Bdellovibrionales bacterium]|nr:class I SAM-dependent methyltransferase [Bdellovibrionales bacterium]